MHNWKRLSPANQDDKDIVIYRIVGDLIWVASGFVEKEAGGIEKRIDSVPVALGPAEVHELGEIMRGVYNG